MHNLIMAILEAQSKNGEEGEELVNGTITGLRAWIETVLSQNKTAPEFKRLADMLISGEIIPMESAISPAPASE